MHELEALFEGAGVGGGVEDEELDLFPVVAFVLAADDGGGFLEGFAGEEEFAVERVFRQALDEPIGGVEDVAEARDEAVAVPVGAEAVEFFGHPPAGGIEEAVPGFGKKDGGGLGLGG